MCTGTQLWTKGVFNAWSVFPDVQTLLLTPIKAFLLHVAAHKSSDIGPSKVSVAFIPLTYYHWKLQDDREINCISKHSPCKCCNILLPTFIPKDNSNHISLLVTPYNGVNITVGIIFSHLGSQTQVRNFGFSTVDFR